MAVKFRLQAMARLGEPEELDIAPRLVDPRAWFAVLVLLAAVAAAVVWSFVADVPRTVSAHGIVTPAAGLLTVQSPAGGVVTRLSVRAGATVTAGQQVATVLTPQQQPRSVTSPFAGRVVSVQSPVGQPVAAGATVVTLDSGAAGDLVAQLFVPSATAASLGPGLHVVMSVESAPSAAFGLLKGTVRAVGPQTITPDQSSALLGNAVLVRTLTGTGPQRLVTVALDRSGDTRSGYAWTGGHGPPFPLAAQSLLTATVQVGSQRPIDFVFGH